MADKGPKRILVIGLTSHSRAEYVWWTLSFPNVEEFDSVIIDMTALDQFTFNRIVTDDPDKLRNLRKEIATRAYQAARPTTR
jgi:hypothetical protein